MKKVAIIGAGYMGREYAKSISLTPGLKLSGIYSRTPEKTKALATEFDITTIAESIDSLYQKTEADAVVVAVPELSAEQVIKQVFQYPWLALIEKPPGYLPTIANDLLSISKQLSRRAYVAFNRRFYNSTTTAIEMLAQNSGERSLIIQDQEDQLTALSIGQPKEVVENWMYANSIHIIDYALQFCRGEIEEVRTVQPYKPFEPSLIQSLLRFSSGDSATYIGLWNRPGPWSVQICTESVRYEMKPLEQLSIQRKGERHLTALPIAEEDTKCKAGLIGISLQLKLALENKEHKLPTLAEGVRLMDLIQRIYFAAAS